MTSSAQRRTREELMAWQWGDDDEPGKMIQATGALARTGA